MVFGAKRMETGTTKAVHAVLLQMVRPSMSNVDACALTAASLSNFTKWKKRVRDVQLANLCHGTCLPRPAALPAPPTSSEAAAALERFDQFDATLPVQERATFWAAPERAAKTSPPSAAEDQPAAKRRACEENQGNSKPYLYDAHWSNRAACALLIRNRQHAHSAPPASVLAPLPAVEQAVAQQIGEEGAVGGGASEGELERGRHAPEGGYSDGDLDRILQEQLDRLRSSWSHERC